MHSGRIGQHIKAHSKLFHGRAEIENWRQQMGPQRWDSITPEVAKEGPRLELPIDPREVAVEMNWMAMMSLTTCNPCFALALSFS